MKWQKKKMVKSKKPRKIWNIFSKKFERYLKEIWSKISLKLLQNLAQTISIPVIEMVWLYTYSYNYCTAVYVETLGKILGKFKSMFLEVFFRFLSNSGDNFVKNPRKFWGYLGEITREIKNFAGNCKILWYNSWGTLKKLLKKLEERNFKIFRKNF